MSLTTLQAMRVEGKPRDDVVRAATEYEAERSAGKISTTAEDRLDDAILAYVHERKKA